MTKYKSVAFLFPGQGAQYPGMGLDFYERYPSVKEVFQEADDLLKRHLSHVIFKGNEVELTKTVNCQPAIFVMSAALLKLMKELFPQLTPNFSAGLSLGEYTALYAAGVLDFKDACQLVDKRAHYMAEACEKHAGTMSVVLGLSQEQVEELVKEANLPHDLWCANFNAPGQVVISGTLKGVEKGAELAKAKGAKRVMPLAVHGAFHSGLMKSAEERLATAIYETPFHPSKIRVVMNIAAAYPASHDQMREWLVNQLTHPVRWQESLKTLQEETVDLFVEVGCGKTLTGLLKRNEINSMALNIDKTPDLETLAKEI